METVAASNRWPTRLEITVCKAQQEDKITGKRRNPSNMPRVEAEVGEVGGDRAMKNGKQGESQGMTEVAMEQGESEDTATP